MRGKRKSAIRAQAHREAKRLSFGPKASCAMVHDKCWDQTVLGKKWVLTSRNLPVKTLLSGNRVSELCHASVRYVWKHIPSMGRYHMTANEKRKLATSKTTLGG